MAYNQSTGSLRVGDLLNEDDNDTSIDWDSDKIQFKTNNTLRFIIDNNGCGYPSFCTKLCKARRAY